MRMRLTIDFHPLPRPFRDFDLRRLYLRVTLQKMFAGDESEALDLLSEMLLRQNVDRVLHRIGRHDPGVIARGVGRREIAPE